VEVMAFVVISVRDLGFWAKILQGYFFLSGYFLLRFLTIVTELV